MAYIVKKFKAKSFFSLRQMYFSCAQNTSMECLLRHCYSFVVFIIRLTNKAMIFSGPIHDGCWSRNKKNMAEPSLPGETCHAYLLPTQPVRYPLQMWEILCPNLFLLTNAFLHIWVVCNCFLLLHYLTRASFCKNHMLL